ncbi:membrane protein hypothetical protein [Bacillus sp. CN2]|nr:membrane protein hypothetical protein [Bacillus velezensis]BCU88323.1 hypothetical protein KOF112_35880 [Bacillus velezensis]GFR55281.1 membrane protein hypothetical protein [Bacillus sp. CN2]
MLITKRGIWWEVLHSWWLLLTFAPFALTAFLAFFYIGYRAKNKKWLKYGLIYFISNCFCAAEHAGRVYRAAFMDHLHYPRAESAGGLFNTA